MNFAKRRTALLLSLILMFLSVTSFAKPQKLEIKIEPGQMHCEDCAKSVKKALKTLPEIEGKSVQVVLEKNMALVTLAKSDIPADQMTALIEKIKTTLKTAGYDAEVLTKN